MIEKLYYKSKIGVLEIILQDGFVSSVQRTEETFALYASEFTSHPIVCEIEEYFNTKRKYFSLKLKPEGTSFQQLVWNELLKIPYGQTKSYQEIANNIGKPHAQRAVGLACNRNPILILIPCHRVIAKNGKLSGFALGTDVKQQLLNLEKSY